ncbi:hypothetical protein BCR36DRAFT_416588 [Piromyces finnis]|uniref:NlpC/P60 domain-containing protein n=1 Tax=Piromyces finnis TaxID=1754191 RepID=A0A1Y1UUI0_9FUNG|nr:hypothetical protein BCR36DRAFT_416588 [Piromyces finnis]|eukprot:ORX41693.1 hypothetical protein BCR36DRAFT_416588 [Piromyces finnis]
MRFNTNLVLSFLLSVPAALAAVNGRCSSGNGVCVSTTSCTNAGGTYVSGKCPNDPSNVKCCNKTKCVAPNGAVGSCKFTSDCTGTTYSGLCPGGSNFKCCVTAPVKVTGTEIVNFARNYIGYPYVWGGNSLTNGCDCSGFTKLVFGNFGITIPRVSSDQANSGTSVSSLSNAKAGDLLFYCTDGKVTHVALYEGSYKIVHAANSKRGIVEDTNINKNSYYGNPCKIRRVL